VDIFGGIFPREKFSWSKFPDPANVIIIEKKVEAED